MKKFLSLLLACMMLMGVLAVSASAEEATKLTFWTFQELHTQFMKPAVERWNANPDNPKIELETVVYPLEEMNNKLTIALQTGTGAPDICDVEIGTFANYLKGEVQFAPMNEYIEPLKDVLVMSRFNNYAKDGNYYGIDYHVGAMVVYYNTEILEAAGINYKDIKTWDDFHAAGQKVLEATGKPMTSWESTDCWSIYPLVNQHGGDRDGIYLHWYRSSLIIMIYQTAIGLFLGSVVGYGLAMYRFRGRGALFFIVLVLLMIPFEILLLPLYQLMIKAKLIDTYTGVVIPYLVPPFMVFFFRQYVSGLPHELLEAGRIDGCTDYGIFFRIYTPIMIPAYGAMTILSGMNSWNNLLWPLVVLSSNEKFTIPIGMGTTITPYGNAYDVLMPGAVAAVVPIIIVYLFCQRAFMTGLTAGSVKG